MNALEIIAELKRGKEVQISATDAMLFIAECERHGETSIEISMVIEWPKCTLSAPAYREEGQTDQR